MLRRTSAAAKVIYCAVLAQKASLPDMLVPKSTRIRIFCMFPEITVINEGPKSQLNTKITLVGDYIYTEQCSQKAENKEDTYIRRCGKMLLAGGHHLLRTRVMRAEWCPTFLVGSGKGSRKGLIVSFCSILRETNLSSPVHPGRGTKENRG